MQDLQSGKPEAGDVVVIDWPRSRWDGRQGRLISINHEHDENHGGVVLINSTAIRFATVRIKKANRPKACERSLIE
jgi:hypothetical protein